MGSGERFDSIARILGGNLSRRKALKLALGGAAGMASTSALLVATQGTAGAVCLPGCAPTQQCCSTNVLPTPSFCAPLTSVCCGNSACVIGQQCCTTATPNFCAPAFVVCCGSQACVPFVSQCCTTGSAPHCEPALFQCCGNVSCPPGQTCQGYPTPGVCV